MQTIFTMTKCGKSRLKFQTASSVNKRNVSAETPHSLKNQQPLPNKSAR